MYNINITKEKRPKLYTIPLAVNDITYHKTLTRTEKRLKARKILDIPEESIVILFLGRLSFHAKSHPLTLYKTISKISTEKDTKEIVLYVEGRHIKDIMRSFSHEMIHHHQNLEGRLNSYGTVYTKFNELYVVRYCSSVQFSCQGGHS